MKQPIPGLAEHVTSAAAQAHEAAQKLRDARDRRRLEAIRAERKAMTPAQLEAEQIAIARKSHALNIAVAGPHSEITINPTGKGAK